MEEPVLLEGIGTLFELVPRVRWETDFERLSSLRRLAAGARSGDAPAPSVLQLPKVASRWLKYAAAGVAKIADGFVVSRTLSAGMVRALERVSTQAWKSAMSPCGQFLALLGDDRLEIAQRSNDFDFGRTKSTVEVDFDPFRGWRKIAWSHDSNLVAIAGSDGGVDIVSANGHRLTTILNELPAGPGDIASTTRRRHYVDSLPNAGAKGSVGILDPVAILLFVDPGVRSGKNGTANEDGETSPTNELLVAGFDGVLRSYAIDALRFVAPPPSPNFDTPPESFVTIFQEGSDDVMGIVKFNHSFSFRPYHSIVTTGLFDRQTNVLTVCGRSPTTSKADKPEDDISFWKLTATDARYTKLGGGPAPLATAEKPPPIAGILERINDVVSPRRTILDSSLSPDGKLLATVGSAGELRIWSYATGRCVREYDQDETTFILGGLSEDSLSQRLMVRRVVTEPDEDEDFDDSDSEAADEWSDTDDIDDLVRRRRPARSTSVTSVSSVAGAGRRIVSVAEGQPAAISEDGKFLPTLVSARWWSEQVLVLCFSSGHTVLFDVFGDEGNQALLNLRFPSAPTMVVQPGDTIYVLYQDAPNEDPEDSDLPGLTDIVTAPFQLMTNLILWHWDTEDTLVAPPGHQPRPPRYNFSTIHVTTPEQALQSRIRHGQYVAALDLCLAFELDTDPVFKAQFESQEITPKTIQEVLGQIKDDYFVLEACVNRVPDDPEACRALLEFGLRKTGLEEDVSVDEVLELLDIENARLGKGDDFGNNMLMVDLCRYRADLLAYVDRLSTFELIGSARKSVAGSAAGSGDRITRTASTSTPDMGVPGIRRMPSKPQTRQWANFSASFTRFRDRNLLIECMERAIRGDFLGVQILFTRHGKDCLPFRFGILEQIPEILDPASYSALLPRVAENGLERLWTEESWRSEPDWVEDKAIASFMDAGKPVPPLEPTLPFVSYPTTGTHVREWYISRIRAVDRLSGLERNALQLVDLAIKECGIDGEDMELIRENLRTLCHLVYDISPGHSPTGDKLDKLSLVNLESMEPMEVIRLMLRDVDSESVVSAIRSVLTYPPDVVQSHWSKMEKVTEPEAMVRTWLRDMAADKHLDVCCEAIEAASPWSKEPGGPLPIASDFELTELILDCCYLYPASDERALGYLNRMFDCLPEVRRIDRMVSTDPQDVRQMLQDGDELVGPFAERVREFDRHLVCCEILARMDVPTPLSALASYEASAEMQSSLIKKLARRAGEPKGSHGKSLVGSGDEDHEDQNATRVEKLVGDLLVLRNLDVLGKLMEAHIYREVVSSVLGAGDFATAKALLANQSHPLPDDIAEDLVVSAACEFFDNAESGDRSEGGLKMAEECLRILPVTPRINKELDLILATDELYRNNVSLKHGLDILPIQVRLSENRLDLVARRITVDRNAPYRVDKIILLLHRLGLRGDKVAEARVHAMLVDAALNNSDFAKAHEICSKMMRSIKHDQVDLTPLQTEVWNVCYRLGSEKRFSNMEARVEVIGFALTLSPEAKMSELLDIHSRLEEMIRVEELSDPARTTIYGLRTDIAPPVIWRRGSAAEFDAIEAWDDIESTVELFPADLAGEGDMASGVAWSEVAQVPTEAGKASVGKARRSAYGFQREEASMNLLRLVDLPREEQLLSLRLAADAVLLKLASNQGHGSDMLDKVLSTSAFHCLSVDTARAVSLLLDTAQEDAARRVFDRLYPSSFNEHLALYYYSLRCLYELSLAGGVDLDPRTFSPFEVMRFVGNILGDPLWDKALQAAVISGDPMYTSASEAVGNVRTAAKALRTKREDQLLQIACDRFGLSRTQFETDEEYRTQAIVDMMGSPDPQWLSNALFLAGTWNISRERATTSYLTWLFVQSDLTSEQMTSKLLLANEAILDVAASIFEDICSLHGHIPGVSADTLVVYYRFLRSLAETVPAIKSSVGADGLEQLETRESVLEDFDGIPDLALLDFRKLFRAVYESEDRLIVLLTDLARDVLSAEPVVAVVPSLIELRALRIFSDEYDLQDSVPPIDDIGHVVSTFTLNHAQRLVADALDTRDVREQDAKYGACERLLANMMASEVSGFLDSVCVGTEALRVPLKHRLSFATETYSIFTERYGDESSETARAGSICDHLKAITEITHLSDPSTGGSLGQDFVDSVDLVFGEPQQRLARCREMISSRQSPYLVHRVASCFAKMSSTDEGLASKLDVSVLYSDALKEALASDPDPALSRLSEIVSSVITYETLPGQSAADYQWLAILEDSMLSTLRTLSGDSSLDSSRRRALMAIINRDFVLKEEEVTELRAIKVQEIIRDAFGREVAASDLERTEKRLQVVLSILESLEEDDAEKIASLRAVLDEFTAEAIETGATELPDYLHACWGYLLKWLVGRNMDMLTFDILLAARKIPLVNEEEEQEIVSILLMDRPDPVPYLTTGLLAHHPGTLAQISEYLASMEPASPAHNVRLVHLLVAFRGLLGSAGTALRSAACDSLLRVPRGADARPYRALVRQAVADLVNAGDFSLSARLAAAYFGNNVLSATGIRERLGLIPRMLAETPEAAPVSQLEPATLTAQSSPFEIEQRTILGMLSAETKAESQLSRARTRIAGLRESWT